MEPAKCPTDSKPSSNSKASSSAADSNAGGAGEPDSKSRGWPKGKKRYPKMPGAPKQPLSGYVHFLNDRRESVKKECPDISFADISKKMANEWSQLGAEDKQAYNERAEKDKERYAKDFLAYQGTDEYKNYMEAQEQKEKVKTEAEKAGGSAAKEPPKKKTKKAPEVKKAAPAPPVAPNEDSNEAPTSSKFDFFDPNASSGIDMPIFTEEFLEYNKCRETELRQLRKQMTEMEEQNAILQKHVDNMKSAIGKLETENSQQIENNSQLSKHLDALKQMLVNSFGKVVVPGQKEMITLDNVEAFIKRIHAMTVEKSVPVDQAFMAKVKEVISQMDYKAIAS